MIRGGRLLRRLLVTCALLLPTAARADESFARWIGLPVADVQLLAPAGGLPDSSLEPLLRARAGAPLNPADVRADLATLFQVGQFASVDADVEPWVLIDADGESIEAVLLSYVIAPAPRIGRVRVEGDLPRVSRRDLVDATGLRPGGVFYPDHDRHQVIAEVERFFSRRGYIQPTVELETAPRSDGRLLVTLRVDPGPPNLIERLAFAGDLEGVLPRAEKKLRRWARRAGVREGRPYEPEAVQRAQQEIRSELATLRGGPFQRKRGHVGARVTPAVIRTSVDAARITYTIEPGPELELQVHGLGWRGARQVQSWLGIDERLRLTRGWLEQAPDRLKTQLSRKGWLDARAQATLVDLPDGGQSLRVRVEKGPRHTLPTGTPPDWVGLRFEGNQTLTDAELQRVIDQASQDVIRRDWFTPEELATGLSAARDLYRARGYQDARLELVETTVRPRPLGLVGMLGTPFRLLSGKERRVLVQPTVRIDEGPLTRLAEVRVVGAAEDVDASAVLKELDALAGEPFSPQKLEAMSRRLLEKHRSAGYLEATIRVSSQSADELSRSATLEVEPGTRVLVRSIVVRGPRFTHPSFVQRELESEIALGEPLDTPTLDRIRSNLYDLGIFRSVDYSLVGEDAARDLVLDLAERGRWTWEVGAGVATDQGLRTFGRITRRNLWGRAHRIDVVGQVGLVWGSDSIQDWIPDYRNPEWRLALSYTAPRFPSRSQDLILDGLIRELQQEPTWRLARSGAGVAFENRLGRRTQLRTGLRLETRQLEEVDRGALLEGEPWLGLIDNDLPSRWRMQETISSLLVHDLRDDALLPTRGTLLSANVEFAPGIDWRSEAEQPISRHLKASARATAYVPLGRLTLRTTLEGGHALSLNDSVVPLEDRFRLGGTGSLRGFRRDAVGPRNLASHLDIQWPRGLDPLIDYTVRDDSERWVPTGGDTSALGSFELLVPLPVLGATNWEGYALALFADVGNVWLLGPNATATSELPAWSADVPLLRVGTGIGARAATPIGPLQFDFAFNPQALTATGSRRALLVDRWEEPSFRAHLSLGALF